MTQGNTGRSRHNLMRLTMKYFFHKSNRFHLDGRGLGISILYMALGGWWILITDDLAEILAIPNEMLSVYHNVKGWGYVVVTGAFLYILIYYNNRSLHAANHELDLLMMPLSRAGRTRWICAIEKLRVIPNA